MTYPIWFINTLAHVLLDEDATGGTYDLLEMTAPQGHRPPPHVHHAHGEGWTVLAGELTVHTAEGSTTVSPGQAMFSPAGETHTIEVTSSEPCRMLVCSVPAGFAAFVRAFGEPAETDTLPVPDPPDADRLTRVADEHGITMLPSLAAPAV